MMENMVMARFKNLEDAKSVYTYMKNSAIDSNIDFKALQIVLLENDEGRINVLDQYTEKLSEFGKTVIGGLAGLVLGVMIGPFAGFVLGGVGAMIGSGFDITDQSESEGMLYQMYSRIYHGDIVILAIVQEEDELVLNSAVGKKAIDIYRWNAAEIKEEAEYATEIRENLVKDVRKKLKAEKNQTRKSKIEEYKESIKEEFNKIGKKDK
ncbi:DUF456 domain-containing protein [Peptostreptococcus faecalis]|uniref:DUF456 domain-containing protein n=1 Tax=Peptostreptococcus faecalis TaxID=2045015 RepID=UPI000C79B0BC|nr:DUF456 domain-containing protein [Peptostreptococcus faecalis]